MNKCISLIILLAICVLGYSQSQLIPGQIGCSQTICYGTAPQQLLFLTDPSGGTGSYSYRWQRLNTNDDRWTDITGTSGSVKNYFPPVLGRTTFFKCKVTDSSQAVSYTDSIKITVLEDLRAGSIMGPQTTFAGTKPQPVLGTIEASGGLGTDAFSYRWQRSPDGWYWTNIDGAKGKDYTPEAMISDQWFRRFVVDPKCGSVAAQPIKISVNDITIYGNSTPESATNSYGQELDLGTEFNVSTDGIITTIRIYTGSEEGGVHEIRLWRRNDDAHYELLRGPIDWDIPEGTAGWKEFILHEPIQIERNRDFMISISTSETHHYWSDTWNYSPNGNPYLEYKGSFSYSPVGDTVPWWSADENAGYFRDIVFVPFTPGSVGREQIICYNAVPEPLQELEKPTGAGGYYIYQWQSSLNGHEWSDLTGATAAAYSPSALTSTTWFRRIVKSESLTISGEPVVITVNPRFSLAQLGDPATIYANTATNISISMEGGTQPYLIEYTRNNQQMPVDTAYLNGADIYTGPLNGTFEYELMAVRDVNGCVPEYLGSPITITATGEYQGTTTAKALVIINTANSTDYRDYNLYVRAYLNWFGIPYDTCDVASTNLPAAIEDYAIVILGHPNVYQNNYPISEIQNAIQAGTGFYSFDPHFFDFPNNFSLLVDQPANVSSYRIQINPNHFISRYHKNDEYDEDNETLQLLEGSDGQTFINYTESNYDLIEAEDLAWFALEDDMTASLLQIASYSNGRVVKWNSIDWMRDDKDNIRVLGPLMGMDDLLWRSIVWAARKPFVMQGVQPMLTMRVDDVDGRGGYNEGEILMKDLEWLKISNEYGFIPWCGTFIENTQENFYQILRDLIQNNLATASPHSFDYYDNFIFHRFPHDSLDLFIDCDPAENVHEAWNFYEDNSIPVSNYMVPHWYALAEEAVTPIAERGIEYIGTYLKYGDYFGLDNYPGADWLNCGPYRINRYNVPTRGYALTYSDTVTWLGNKFFICVTEIQDDGGYEWYPDTDLDQPYYQHFTISRGIRHLRRAINSMVLPTLFTHEDRLKMTNEEWRQILSEITTEIMDYYPEYDIVFKSMDDACRYMRAKVNLKFENVTIDDGLIGISVSGENDIPTKCYLFTEEDNHIHFRMVTLPQVTDSLNPITICISE